LPPLRDQWERERDRIAAWIEDHNWSDAKQPFCIPGSKKLDASIALAVRFQFDGEDRLLRTFDAIQRELSTGPYHYRYISVAQDEGCFDRLHILADRSPPSAWTAPAGERRV
jgi:GH15 family glucan-1,4-alpha-glucosidase